LVVTNLAAALDTGHRLIGRTCASSWCPGRTSRNAIGDHSADGLADYVWAEPSSAKCDPRF